MSLTDTIKRLRKLDRKATPGPWYAAEPSLNIAVSPNNWPDEGWTITNDPNSAGWETDGGCEGYGISKGNADLLAESRNALPILLDALDDAIETMKANTGEDGGWNCNTCDGPGRSREFLKRWGRAR